MRVELDDGTIFKVDEDLASPQFVDKICRIMSYMTYDDVVIAKGLAETLGSMCYKDDVKKVVKEYFCEFCEEE